MAQKSARAAKRAVAARKHSMRKAAEATKAKMLQCPGLEPPASAGIQLPEWAQTSPDIEKQCEVGLSKVLFGANSSNTNSHLLPPDDDLTMIVQRTTSKTLLVKIKPKSDIVRHKIPIPCADFRISVVLFDVLNIVKINIVHGKGKKAPEYVFEYFIDASTPSNVKKATAMFDLLRSHLETTSSAEVDYTNVLRNASNLPETAHTRSGLSYARGVPQPESGQALSVEIGGKEGCLIHTRVHATPEFRRMMRNELTFEEVAALKRQASGHSIHTAERERARAQIRKRSG